MRLVCQIFIAVLFAVGFLRSVQRAIDGREAEPATGFRGVMFTMVDYGVTVAIFFLAGAFSMLLGGQ